MIVLVLNGGAVIGYGFRLARGTKTSSEWFLGSRALPWWAIGLSMFATNVDSADLVSVTGQTYKEGLHIVTVQDGVVVYLIARICSSKNNPGLENFAVQE